MLEDFQSDRARDEAQKVLDTLARSGKIPKGLREPDLAALLRKHLGVSDVEREDRKKYNTDAAVSGVYRGTRFVFGADRRGALDAFLPR